MSQRDPEKLFFHDNLMRPFVLWLPKKVTPNHLTILRMILTPVVLVLLFFKNYDIGIPLFFFTAFTDAMDGSLARLRKQVTNWGIFYDPIADKALVGSVLLLIAINYIHPILAISLVIMELCLIFGGWYRLKRGVTVHANFWGKFKMFFDFSGLLMILISLWLNFAPLIDLASGTFILALIFGLISLMTYSL